MQTAADILFALARWLIAIGIAGALLLYAITAMYDATTAAAIDAARQMIGG